MASLNYSACFCPLPFYASTAAITNVVLDASGDRWACIFMMKEAATLTHGAFRYIARTGTPPTYNIKLCAVDASGNPDLATVHATQTFTPPASTAWDLTTQWVAFASSYGASRGQMLALVIDYNTGTIDGSNNSTFARFDGGFSFGRTSIPYVMQDLSAGTWTRSATATAAVYGVKSASKAYGNPYQGVTTTTLTSSGHRATKKFTLPAGSGASLTVVGIRMMARAPNASGQTYIVGLWDAAGAVVQAVTMDSDAVASIGGTFSGFEIYFDDTPVALDFGSPYYAGIERVGSDVSFYSLNLAAAGDATAYPLGGSAMLSTWNGSAWSDSDVNLPMVELLIEDWTEPSAGGGLLRPVGMTGGLV
jgi:hypothetical protein